VDNTQVRLYLKVIYIAIPVILLLMLISQPRNEMQSGNFGAFLYMVLMALVAALCLLYMKAPDIERKRRKVQLISGRVSAINHNPSARTNIVNGASATGVWVGIMQLTVNGQSMYFKTSYGGSMPPVQVGDNVTAAVIPNVKGPSNDAFEVLMLRDDTRGVSARVPEANWDVIAPRKMFIAAGCAALLCFTIIIPVVVVLIIRAAFLTRAAWNQAIADAERLIAAPAQRPADNLLA
jgi:hypothetical protein